MHRRKPDRANETDIIIMAHNIESRNGKSSIVWAGETPWHRLGQKVEDAFDAGTALRLGGLDFAVEKQPISLASTGKVISGRHAIVRTDTQDVLGVVGDMYRPLQNKDAFAFFDGAFGKDKARYEVAGVLGKGEQVWLLARLPGEFTVGKEDLVNRYLLLTNGHTGNDTVRAKFTPIRVVCQNTLSAALRDGTHEVRVQHIGNVSAKLEIAGKLLSQAGVYFDEVQDSFNRFLSRRVRAAGLRRYAIEALTDNTKPFEELHPLTQRAVNRVEELAETGRGMDIKGVRGTLWAAYNAVTEYVDHDKTVGKVDYMARGRGLEIKHRAFTVARDLALSVN